METAIQTKDLTKEYRQGKNIVMGVDHVNISVASGEFTSDRGEKRIRQVNAASLARRY